MGPAWGLLRKRLDAVRFQSSEKFRICIFIVGKCFVPNRGCAFLVHDFKRPALAAFSQSIYLYPHANPVPRHASAKGRIFDLGFIVISHVVILALICLSGPAKPTFIKKTGSFDCLPGRLPRAPRLYSDSRSPLSPPDARSPFSGLLRLLPTRTDAELEVDPRWGLLGSRDRSGLGILLQLRFGRGRRLLQRLIRASTSQA